MPDFIKQTYWTICFYGFLLLFLSGTIAVNLLSLILLAVLPAGTARCILRKTTYHMFDLYLRMMEASTTLITNRGVLDRINTAEGGLLIIANHPSILDAPIFFSRIRGLTCVFKSSLNRSLGIGRTAKAIGYLSNDGGLDMIRELSAALKSGEKVLLFPEGTRTTTGTVDSFNPGYALAAMRAQVPLQLIRIHSDTPILSKKQSTFSRTRFPCTFRLEPGPVIEPGDFNTVKSFNAFVESWYRSTIGSNGMTVMRFLPVMRESSESDDSLTCSFRIPADPFYCRGHMPGDPIVPAYAQMAWASELLMEMQPEVAGQIEYFRWKFLNPIVPGNRITMQINRAPENMRVMIAREEQTVTQGLLRIPPENP